MIGGNQQLHNYVLHAQGIGRKGLNIMCFIGVFIFGWLLAVAFEMLGKKKQGWAYVIPILICLVISRQSESPLGALAPILYIVGWVHANKVLSGYQSSARKRIAQIEQLPQEELTVDVIMEKGVLQSKVLASPDAAAAALAQALQMPGGDPQLLNLSGVALFASKRYAQAKEFFERAAASAKDEALIKLAKQNQANAEKNLNKKSAKRSS